MNSAAAGGGYANPDFVAAAREACEARATRHGRVSITRVDKVGADAVRVYGGIQTGYNARNFECTFHSVGRITDFDLK